MTFVINGFIMTDVMNCKEKNGSLRKTSRVAPDAIAVGAKGGQLVGRQTAPIEEDLEVFTQLVGVSRGHEGHADGRLRENETIPVGRTRYGETGWVGWCRLDQRTPSQAREGDQGHAAGGGNREHVLLRAAMGGVIAVRSDNGESLLSASFSPVALAGGC